MFWRPKANLCVNISGLDPLDLCSHWSVTGEAAIRGVPGTDADEIKITCKATKIKQSSRQTATQQGLHHKLNRKCQDRRIGLAGCRREEH